MKQATTTWKPSPNMSTSSSVLELLRQVSGGGAGVGGGAKHRLSTESKERKRVKGEAKGTGRQKKRSKHASKKGTKKRKQERSRPASEELTKQPVVPSRDGARAGSEGRQALPPRQFSATREARKAGWARFTRRESPSRQEFATGLPSSSFNRTLKKVRRAVGEQLPSSPFRQSRERRTTKSGIVLHGPPGCGKTSVLCALPRFSAGEVGEVVFVGEKGEASFPRVVTLLMDALRSEPACTPPKPTSPAAEEAHSMRLRRRAARPPAKLVVLDNFESLSAWEVSSEQASAVSSAWKKLEQADLPGSPWVVPVIVTSDMSARMWRLGRMHGWALVQAWCPERSDATSVIQARFPEFPVRVTRQISSKAVPDLRQCVMAAALVRRGMSPAAAMDWLLRACPANVFRATHSLLSADQRMPFSCMRGAWATDRRMAAMAVEGTRNAVSARARCEGASAHARALDQMARVLALAAACSPARRGGSGWAPAPDIAPVAMHAFVRGGVVDRTSSDACWVVELPDTAGKGDAIASEEAGRVRKAKLQAATASFERVRLLGMSASPRDEREAAEGMLSAFRFRPADRFAVLHAAAWDPGSRRAVQRDPPEQLHRPVIAFVDGAGGARAAGRPMTQTAARAARSLRQMKR